MSDDLVYRIRSKLKAQSYLVNDSWLRECIEYYVSENTDASLNAVQAFVTSQWLLSDLREINNEKGSVPPNLSLQDKILLQGKYIIQVDKMWDISQSKYSQLQKIRNVSEVNVKATEIEAPAWEPKGKRMTQMYLTDGVQDFTAIEYRTIKGLKDTLLPGFKLMIIGPVMCRKGVIMLKEENYKEIGGEVDSLLKVNALENLLARAIGMAENENPYADDNQENTTGQTNNAFPEDEFEINLDEITQIEQLSMEAEDLPVGCTPNIDNLHPRNNMPDHRIDETSTNNSSRRPKTSSYNASRNEIGNSVQRKTQQATMVEDFDHPFNDLTRSNNCDPNPLLGQNEKPRRSELKIVSRTQLKPMISLPSSCQYQDNVVDKFHSREMEGFRKEEPRNDCRDRSDLPCTSNVAVAVFPADEYFDVEGFEDELNEDTLRNNKTIHSSRDSWTMEISSKVTETGKKIESIKKMPLMTSKIGSPGGNSPTLSVGKRSADMISPLRGSPKMICTETRKQSNKKNRKITEFTEKLDPKEDIPPKICDFICDVIKEPSPATVMYKTVRGRVTQIGKLLKKDKNWDLKATIADCTASVEIMFASQVLEELIGFSVAEFLKKRKLRKTNPEVEEYLREGFRKAEIRVQRMDVLMELELSTENEMPKVINTTELTEEHKRLIEKRMKMMIV